eukprot:6817748-Pyramimonas_sp.AAC.1
MAKRASVLTTVGDSDPQIIAALHHRPSPANEVISQREQSAHMSIGVSNKHVAQRHYMILPH